MSGHAFLAPSSAARWVACPGSAAMEAAYPEQGDRPEAAEGTAAHWVMEMMLTGHAVPLGTFAPNGVSITAEIWESAQVIYDDITETLGANWPALVVIERLVRIPRVHAQHNYGTPDVRAWVDRPAEGRKTLYVWDFKHGHSYVDAFENWQLIDYAAGLLSEANDFNGAAGLPAFSETHIDIVFRVVQPRAYHPDGPVREWRTTADALRSYVFRLSMAAEEATGDSPPCKPVAAACENCTARHACTALQTAAYRGMDIAKRAQAAELSPAALGLELRLLTEAAALIEARKSGLEEQVDAIITSGKSVPHWTKTRGTAREVWAKDAAEVIALGDMMGLDLRKPTDAVTPTQAKAKGLPASLVSQYSVRPAGSMKLVLDDGSAARKVFTKI